MRQRAVIIVLVATMVTLLTMGCALAQIVGRESPTPMPIPTRTPQPTFTSTPDATDTPLPTATFTPEPTPTPTDTPEPTPTPTDTPIPTDTPVPNPQGIITLNDLNFRAGPGTNYGVLGKLSRGYQMDVSARLADGSWVRVCCYNDQEGWVASQYIDLSVPMEQVPIDDSIPPTPTPRPRPPTATPAPPTATPVPAPPKPTFPFELLKGVERCDPNLGVTYFEGYVRYRSNELRNAVCVHIGFHGPRNTKCSGCDGVGDGRWGFSPFGGPAPPGTTVEIFVVPCSGAMPSGGQTEQTGFGDLTPLSEKWVYTVQQSTQCTGITFVGD